MLLNWPKSAVYYIEYPYLLPLPHSPVVMAMTVVLYSIQWNLSVSIQWSLCYNNIIGSHLLITATYFPSSTKWQD